MGYLDEFNDVNLICDKFYSLVYESLDMFVPKTVKRRRNYPPWYNSDIIKLIKKKFSVWKKYKRNKNARDLEEFRRLRARVKTDIGNAYKNYCRDVENQIVNNPSNFWRFVNSKRNNRSLPEVLSRGEDMFQDSKDIANAFANFFQSSYINSSTHENILFDSDSCDNIDIGCVSEEHVCLCLKRMKQKGTVGPDKIPSFLLHDCAILFASPLAKLFNLCLKTCCFPTVWKVSKITPVYKKGSRECIENYRPVSILCNFAKCFEILLHEVIVFQVKNKISCYQHGFVKGRSTTSNLFCITQFIAEALDEKCHVDVIYTDFSKAFDRLDHSILLNQLNIAGLSKKLLLFFKSYLHNRKQFVECCGQSSVEIEASSGVPQGSILGPLLFNLFINNILDGVGARGLLYADDMKVFSRIRTIGDCQALQASLDNIFEWCRNNNLPLNPDKCRVVSYTLKSDLISFDYNIGNTVLGRESNFHDLGIIFDNKLSFAQHISEITQSASRALGFVIRNSRDFINVDTLKLLYFAFVRSKLEYGSVTWSPFYQVHINRLERLQRRFLKFLSFRIDGVYPAIGISHDNLLSRHSFSSLQDRRAVLDLKFLHNVINFKVDCVDILNQMDFTSYVCPTGCDIFYPRCSD